MCLANPYPIFCSMPSVLDVRKTSLPLRRNHSHESSSLRLSRPRHALQAAIPPASLCADEAKFEIVSRARRMRMTTTIVPHATSRRSQRCRWQQVCCDADQRILHNQPRSRDHPRRSTVHKHCLQVPQVRRAGVVEDAIFPSYNASLLRHSASEGYVGCCEKVALDA